MRIIRKLITMLGATLAFSGCATGVSYQEFKSEAPIKTIAVLTASNPVNYHAMDFGSPALAFGAVGGAVAGASAASDTEKFNAAVKTANFDFSKELTARLTQYLGAQGFKVIAVSVKRESPIKMVEDYSGVPNAGADAILDIGTRSVGYSTVNMMDRDFRPHVQMDFRLVSARDKTVLYSEQVLFGYHNPFMSATELPADKQFYFKGFNALISDKKKAVDGLKAGADSVAKHVAGRLKI